MNQQNEQELGSLELAQAVGMACHLAFGAAYKALEVHDRALLMRDVRQLSDDEDLGYADAARELHRRIHGQKHLASYLDCLRASEEREARELENLRKATREESSS